MPSMKNVKELPNVHALVYGDPKTGKSTFAATFPEPGYIFLLEDDSAAYAGKDFDYDYYNPTDPDVYTKICDKLDVLQESCKYKSIIVDTLTEFAVCVEDQILRINNRGYDASLTKPYNDKTHGMRIQDWGVFKTRIENFIRNMHALNANTVVTAHEVTKQTGDASIIKGCLSVNGNFGETGSKMFNTVLRTKVIRGTFSVQTLPDRLFTAGCWGARLPDPWENPTFQGLEEAFVEWQKQK